MDLIHIFVFAGLALPFMWLVPAQWRSQGLIIGGVLAIAWMMGDGGFSSLDSLLLMSTLALTIGVWWLIQPRTKNNLFTQDDKQALMLLFGTGILLSGLVLIDSAIDVWLNGLGIIVALSAVGISASQFLPSVKSSEDTRNPYKPIALILILAIIAILVGVKLPALADYAGYQLDWDADSLNESSPLVWLGFSYVAFRLIGVLLDYRAGRLPKDGFTLQSFTTYVLFFPAFTAGPIDRAQRFIPELEQNKILDSPRLVEGLTRIAVGVFKKFVIADTLALVAMSPQVIERIDQTWGLWIVLYLYAFQIFFDFSGYSDVAIGLGRLYGVSLPENFNRPYLQANIQQFWQRWHITLSTWFRIYYFTPLSRFFIKSKLNIPQNMFIFMAQISTMILIGLWHGITVNFFLWGIWHGIGLFLHKLLADNTRGWTKRVNSNLWSKRVMYVGGWVTTFHFVALGWVFFALPEPSTSFNMLRALFGMGG